MGTEYGFSSSYVSVCITAYTLPKLILLDRSSE